MRGVLAVFIRSDQKRRMLRFLYVKEPLMLKRSIKDILLVLSVILAFVLIYQIWFGSYFLPNGADYILSGVEKWVLNPVSSLFRSNREADFSQNLNTMLAPEKIIVNVSGKRFVFFGENPAYNECLELSEEIMEKFLSGEYRLKSKEETDEESYLSVLKGKSIHIDYGFVCDARLFSASLCENANTVFSEDINSLREYVISLQDNILNTVSLFAKDQNSGMIYKYILEVDKSEIESKLLNSFDAESSGTTAMYSFELNFHKTQEETVSKVVFSPTALIDFTQSSLLSAEASQAVQLDNYEDELLSVFNVNTRTVRKYKDLHNAKVFIENNATLTLHDNGFLEYQAVAGEHGLDISGARDRDSYDIYSAVANAVDFVVDVTECLPDEFFENLQISTDLLERSDDQKLYQISFDYCLNGVPIMQKTTSGPAHTISLEIENGYLKSYKQYTKLYYKSSGKVFLPPVLSAADLLVDSLYDGMNPLIIETITPCFLDDEGILVQKWKMYVDGTERAV